MRLAESELEELNTKVAVLTFEAGFIAQAYVEDTGLTWPLMVDEDRSTYEHYEMLEAGFWDVWGPKTLWAYTKELFSGQKLQKSDGDVSQRGGDVLIDPDGVVRLVHVGDGPADRPALEKMLKVIRAG